MQTSARTMTRKAAKTVGAADVTDDSVETGLTKGFDDDGGEVADGAEVLLG
jgi:hypothetical protein